MWMLRPIHILQQEHMPINLELIFLNIFHIVQSFEINSNKFGIDFEALNDVKNILKQFQSLQLTGLTFHLGSQILSLSPIEKALQKIVPVYKQLKASGFPLENLSVGGGI